MKPSRQDSLLAAIQRKPTAPEPVAPATTATPPATATPAAGRRIGKPVQFWLHEEDRKLVRELAAWLAGQGIRPSDSMVVRAALRIAKTGPAFLAAYQEAALLDGRLRPEPRTKRS
jgi:hypothetical protein